MIECSLLPNFGYVPEKYCGTPKAVRQTVNTFKSHGSLLKKYKFYGICILALIIKIKNKIPTNAPYKVVTIKALDLTCF